MYDKKIRENSLFVIFYYFTGPIILAKGMIWYNFIWKMDVICDTLLYIVQCTVCIVQCTLYSVHCTVYIVQCTLYSVYCTVYIVCTVYILHSYQTKFFFLTIKSLKSFYACPWGFRSYYSYLEHLKCWKLFIYRKLYY